MIREVGFVGCGGHVRQVLAPAAVAAGLLPRAFVATSLDSARATALPYGAASSRSISLLARAGLDAIIVAVPPRAIGDVLRSVLPLGLPVYVEKPGASSAAEARELHQLANRSGSEVSVGYMKRYSPAYAGLRDRLDPESISLLSVRWAMGPFGGRDLSDWLVENAVHAVDIALYLAGPVMLHSALVHQKRSEHVVLAAGTTASGAAVSLQAHTTGPWWHDNEVVEATVGGGSFVVNNASTLTLRENDGPELVWRPNFSIPVERNLTGTILGFVPALSALKNAGGDDPRRVDLNGAAQVLALVEQVLAMCPPSVTCG